MFSLSSSLVLALAALAGASAHSFSHARRHAAPAGWATNYLEDYTVYHARYLALDCEKKHDTKYFQECCHPMLKTETLKANRPKWCVPGYSSAAAVHTPSPTAVANVAATSSPAHVAPTQAAGEDEDCEDEDNADEDEEECDEDEEETSDDEDEEDCDEEDEEDTSGDEDEEDCDDDESSEDHSSTKTHPVVASATHPPQYTHATPSTPLRMTTVKVKPSQAPTTTKATTTPKATMTAKATSAKATTTAATGDKSSSGNFITGGFSTWFTQNGVAGACGKVHKDTDFVAALQTEKYAHGTNCGRMIRIHNLSNGKTVDALVADECPTCDNTACVDLSVAAFKQLADLSVGEFKIKYEYLN